MIKNMGRAKQPLKCAHCDRQFYRKDHLKNHERTHFPNLKVFICERTNCGKAYRVKVSLKKHLAWHSAQEGDFACKLCTHVSITTDEIMQHFKNHSFPRSRLLMSTNEKKFACPECFYAFSALKDLKRHMIVHTGRRDHICQYCIQSFGRKDHLKRHIKSTHPFFTFYEQNENRTGSETFIPEAPQFYEPFQTMTAGNNICIPVRTIAAPLSSKSRSAQCGSWNLRMSPNGDLYVVFNGAAVSTPFSETPIVVYFSEKKKSSNDTPEDVTESHSIDAACSANLDMDWNPTPCQMKQKVIEVEPLPSFLQTFTRPRNNGIFHQEFI